MVSQIPLRYNLRNLAVRRVATVMTALGVALPTATFCAVLALSNGLAVALQGTGDPETIVFLRRSSVSETMSSVSREEAAVLETLDGIARDPSTGEPVVSREAIVLLNLRRLGRSGAGNVTVRGTSEGGRRLRRGVRLVEGRWPGAGLSEVAVSRDVALRFENCSLDSRVPLGRQDWRVVGIFDAGATAYASEIWADAPTLARTFQRPEWSAVWTRATPGQAGLALLHAPASDLRLQRLEAISERDYFARQTALGSPIAGIGFFITLFMAIGAAFAVMNTMYAAIGSRGREIAVLRAMGYRPRSIVASFLVESLVIALLGSGAGAAASLAVNGVSTGTLNFATLSEVAFAFRVSPPVILRGIAFGALLGLAGGLLPALRAARLSIPAAMRAV
jgi:putative ABC transport system permease protein